MKELVNEVVENAIDIANDNSTNFGDVYMGGSYYEEYLNNTKTEIDLTTFIDMMINEIEKDDRVREIGGITFYDTLEIVIKDEVLD